MFRGPLGGDLTMMVEVTLAGFIRGGSHQMVIDYLYYDMDNVG